jgi:hypothetical protein
MTNSIEPFYPIHLLGKEKIHKDIVFVPLFDERFPFGDNPLSPGRYNFQVRILDVSKKGYETKLIFNIDLNEEQISMLSAANYIFPFVEEVKQRRQSLQTK